MTLDQLDEAAADHVAAIGRNEKARRAKTRADAALSTATSSVKQLRGAINAKLLADDNNDLASLVRALGEQESARRQAIDTVASTTEDAARAAKAEVESLDHLVAVTRAVRGGI